MKNTLTFNKLNIVDCVDSLNDGSNELWLHFQRMTSVVVTGHGIIIADPDIKINSSWYLTSDLILNIDGRIITIKHPTTTTGQMMVRRVSDNIYQLSFGGESGIVDITPVLTEGVEIAQYTIDGETGSIYAPEGVSKEYVDNADLNVKKTTAKASNDKYDESVIPSQLTNKLYVFGNPQGMYPASEIGGDVPAITEGRVDYSYDYWGSDVYPNRVDYKIYDSTYNRLFCIKSANDSISNYYSIFCTDGSEEITAIGSDIRQSVRNSLAGHLNTYVQRYSGDPLTPQGWLLETDGVYVAGGSPIYNARTYNSYFGLVGTGIPIFTVADNTTASFDAVNHYISTGDYSGADNYAELYPDNPESYVAIDVISGDWYKVVNSAWVKQGTLALKGSDVVANPEGEATDTLNTIEIDGTIYDIAGGGVSITDLIPLMTSDTTPSGTVSYSSQFGSSYAGYMAFNQVQADISMMTGGWLPSDSDSSPYLQYAWTSPKKLSKLWIETANNGASAQKTVSIEGYNGTSWENCLKSGNTVTLDFTYGQYEEFEIELNGNNYSAIKISGNEQWFYLNSTACTISRMQAYSISGGISADDVSYDNSVSGLSANKVQGAIDELADEKADASSVYTKSETDTLLGGKANTADLGTASAKDFTTSVTQGSNDLVTSGAVWTAIDNLPEPMVFKGTLGTNGTITALPTASSSNEGWTYKVITAGTYAGQTAKVGDLFSSNATEWVYIPSGDETDTDTWRGININGSQLLGNGISSGNVNFKSGTNAQVSGSGNDVTVDVDTTFTDASSRTNIASGDSIKTILGKIKKWFSDLKTVAFTGSYNDLDNKPTIPTVNNGTFTIQKNGTNVQTFSANQSSNATANIEVPTKTSDLTNDSGFVNTVDSTLSDSSTNPLQNKVVTSNIKAINTNGAKNLLPMTLTKLKSANTLGTWNNNAYTYAGITYTANVDSNNNVISITVNGTVPSGNMSVFVLGGKFSNYLTVDTQYTINGMPSGATSQSVPFMQIMNLDAYAGVANVYYNASGVSYTHTSNYDNNGLVIRCNANVNATSVVFYPMIRLASDTDSTFQPYAKTNLELTNQVDSGFVANATKATQDSDGNNIISSYVKQRKFQKSINTKGWHKALTVSNRHTSCGIYLITWGSTYNNANPSVGSALLIMRYGVRKLVPLSGAIIQGMQKIRISSNNLENLKLQIDFYYNNEIINDNCTVTCIPLLTENCEITILDGSIDDGTTIQEISASDEVITNLNIGSQSVASAGLLKYTHTNEINFKGGKQQQVYINYRNADTDSQDAVSAINYYFCNYAGDTSKATIYVGNMSLGVGGSITSGDTKAVTGGAVYDYHNTTPLQISTKCYAEKSGNVVNLQCVGDTLNAISSIPSGYRPKRSIDVPATIIDSNNNYRYSGYIYINNDGSISGGWYKDGEIAHFLSTTDTRYQLYFNTSYIV